MKMKIKIQVVSYLVCDIQVGKWPTMSIRGMLSQLEVISILLTSTSFQWV